MSASKTPDGLACLLANLIISLLAPMFLWSCKGDVLLARRAAVETLGAYCAVGNLSLIRAAKIVAFDLATLSSLSLSMFDDTSTVLALRLRGNAVSLDRAAERNRLAFEQDRRDGVIVAKAAGVTDEDVRAAVKEAQNQVRQAQARMQAEPQTAPRAQAAAPPPPAPAPAAAPINERQHAAPPPANAVRLPATDEQWKTAWAGAMTQVAEEMTAELAGLSPAERAAEVIRIQALNRSATALASGTVTPSYLNAASVAERR
nr:hypothetical protein [uncultured Rhodopila sp.]